MNAGLEGRPGCPYHNDFKKYPNITDQDQEGILLPSTAKKISQFRDALFASGLPFLLSINDVPEAWELYSRAGSITRLCSGKNGSKPELLVVHRSNPAAATGLSEAILCPRQD